MYALWADCRYVMRGVVQRPWPAALTVATLAFGLGLTTALFSVLDAVWLSAVPYAGSGRLVVLSSTTPSSAAVGPSWPDVLDWRRGGQTLDALVALERRAGVLELTGDQSDEASRVTVVGVEGPLFQTLGERPLHGQLLGDQSIEENSIVISHALWHRTFGGEAIVVGQAVRLDGEPAIIIGIAPPRLSTVVRGDVFRRIRPPERAFRGARGTVVALGKLRHDVSMEQAQANMSALAQRLAEEHPDTNASTKIVIASLRSTLVGVDVARTLQLLAVLVGLIMLATCANVANVRLAREPARAHEMAIRAAVGASRWDLTRHLLVEAALMSLVGALAALAVLWLAMDVLVGMIPPTIPRTNAIDVNGRVVVFAGVGAVLTSVLIGLHPAWRLSGPPGPGMRSAAVTRVRGRGILGGSSLLVVQVTLSVVVVISAGLLLRSFVRLVFVDLGFEPQNVVTFTLTARATSNAVGPPKHEASWSALEVAAPEVLAGLGRLPGVAAVGGVDMLPLSGARAAYSLQIEGKPPPPDGEATIDSRRATPGYFEAMGIRVVRGRSFTDDDRYGAPGVTVINDVAARRYWPDEDPLGQRISLGGNRPLTIVGVVGSVRHLGLERDAVPEAYWSWYQHPAGLTIVARTVGGVAPFISALTTTDKQVLGDLTLSSPQALDEYVARGIVEPRFRAWLLGVMAAHVLWLTVIGVAGVAGQIVTQRRREIAIRIAVGARPAQVVGLVLWQSVAPVAVGCIMGLGLASWATAIVEQFLFQTSVSDPLAYLGATALIMIAAIGGAFVPANAAARMAPRSTLGAE